MAERAPMAVVVVHFGDPAATARSLRAAASAGLSIRLYVVRNASLPEAVVPPGARCLGDGRNRGFAAGANEGVRAALAAGATEVLLLNNDAEPEPGAIARLAAVARRRADAGAVGALILSEGRVWHAGGSVDGPGGRPRSFGHGAPAAERPDGDPFDVPFASGCALLVPRRAWDRAGLLDERYFLYFEDVDLCFRIRRAGLRVLLDPAARVHHAPRPASPAPERVYYRVRNRLLFSRTWFGRRGRGARAAFAARTLARGGGALLRGDPGRAWARGQAVLDYLRGRFGPRRRARAP